MTGGLPERLDPREAARADFACQGTLNTSAMTRLRAALAAPEATVSVELSARADRDGWCVLEGCAGAVVRLTCQRCLEPMDVALSAPFALAVVEGDAEIAGVPARYEPLCVGAGEAVTMAGLVEDELLLALPTYPRHAAGECASTAATADPAPRRPFVALKDLQARQARRGKTESS